MSSGNQFPLGITTLTYLVTDAAGNQDSCSFTITIIDNGAPEITCTADITQGTDPASCFATVTIPDPVAIDNCGGVSFSQTDLTGYTSGDQFPIGIYVIEYTAVDTAGNTDVCAVNITVLDTTAPALVCPGNIAQNTDAGACTAIVTYTTPVVSDNCVGSFFFQAMGLSSGALFPKGITTNTFQAIDAYGNTSSCSFTVTIIDSIPPVVTCPVDIIANNTPTTCGRLITYPDPTIVDNCLGSTWLQISGLASGNIFPIGTTQNIFVATDASGNTDTCYSLVTILDVDNPVITCPANIQSCNDKTIYTPPVGTDNCPAAITTLIAGLGSGATFPLGLTTETYVVIDASANTDTCSFTITINPIPVIADSIIPVSCFGFADGEIDLTVTVGISPYSYNWDVGFNIEDLTGLIAGNYKVTVTDINTCTSSVTLTVNQPTQLLTSSSINEIICLGETTEITGSASGGTSPYTYLWGCSMSSCYMADSLSPSTFVTPDTTTTYIFSVTDNNGCLNYSSITEIDVKANPVVDAGIDTTIFGGNSIELQGTCDQEVTYSWEPFEFLDDAYIATPVALPVASTEFITEVLSEFGCYGTDSVLITLNVLLDIPTAITPDNDGVNDVWNIGSLNLYPECTVEIYHPSGKQLFYSQGYDTPWDGTYNGEPLPVGTYYFVITMNGTLAPIPGTITIIK